MPRNRSRQVARDRRNATNVDSVPFPTLNASDSKSPVSPRSQFEEKAIGSGGVRGGRDASAAVKPAKKYKHPRLKCATCLTMRSDIEFVASHPDARTDALKHMTCRTCVQNWVSSQLETGSGVSYEPVYEDGQTVRERRTANRPPASADANALNLEAKVSIKCAQCRSPMDYRSLYAACDVRRPEHTANDRSKRALKKLDRVMCGVGQMKDYLSCPAPNCPGGGFVVLDDNSSKSVSASGSGGAQKFGCNVCGRCFPSLIEEKSSAALSAGWKSKNSKPCPKCHAPIERNGGCPHMT